MTEQTTSFTKQSVATTEVAATSTSTHSSAVSKSSSASQEYANVKVSSVPVELRGGSFNLLVSSRQRGNPILKYIKHVAWEFAPIRPDFVMTRTSCALFLSLRYHLLHPNYIFQRMREIKQDYVLRVLLVQVDLEDSNNPLQQVCHTACLSNFTTILAWSPQEAARYLETYKAYEKKPVSEIQERKQDTYSAQFSDALTTVRSINKTDAATLQAKFGSFANLACATSAQIGESPGLGEKKVQRLHEILHQPFSTTGASDHLRQKISMETVADWRKFEETTQKPVGLFDRTSRSSTDSMRRRVLHAAQSNRAHVSSASTPMDRIAALQTDDQVIVLSQTPPSPTIEASKDGDI